MKGVFDAEFCTHANVCACAIVKYTPPCMCAVFKSVKTWGVDVLFLAMVGLSVAGWIVLVYSSLASQSLNLGLWASSSSPVPKLAKTQ